MRPILLLCLPLFVLAQSYGLKNFIESAGRTNGLIEAKKLTIKSKEQEVEAARSAYWPTVDIGADYSFQSPNYIVSPGKTGNAFISANLNLYDGGRKDAILKSKGFESVTYKAKSGSNSVTLSCISFFSRLRTYGGLLTITSNFLGSFWLERISCSIK